MNDYKSVEAKLSRLEDIISVLENPDTALEDSLSLFEEGIKLSAECKDQLEQARQIVEVRKPGANTNMG
ncbi:MAG: exodeoxyribonuclease VII small subunit [Angelakisella sp.]|nr:exodeoxyribonuclease VII small subunit [Angelakisella sp.]